METEEKTEKAGTRGKYSEKKERSKYSDTKKRAVAATKEKTRDSEDDGKHGPKKGIIIAIAAVLVLGLLIAGGLYLYRYLTAPYVSYRVVYTEEISSGQGTEYLPYLDGYLRVSRDGAEGVDSNGLRLWNVSYSMNNPEAAVCGKYVALADIGGLMLYVTDGDGNVKRVEVPYRIEEIECSLAGVAAVRMNNGSDDYIRLVSIEGETLAEIKTVEAKDGFPVDISLSPDAKKLVTSYLVINGENTEGWLTFYNFGNVGKNYSNNVTGIYKYEKVVPVVKYLDSVKVCAFFDDELHFFSASEVPYESKVISFDEYVYGAYTSSDGVIVMKSSKESGIVTHTIAYDTTGKMVFESRSSNELKGVMFFGKDFLFYNDGACQILDRNGNVKYNGNFGGITLSQIVSSNGKDRFLLFESGRVSTIRLTKNGNAE